MALPEAPWLKSSKVRGYVGTELFAVDLASSSRWCAEESAQGGAAELDHQRLGLHSDGLVSSMGFSFTVANAREHSGELLRVSVQNRSRSDPTAIDRAVTQLRSSGPVRTVHLSCVEPSGAELTLVVGAVGAEVFADDVAWAALAEPVLLCVAQYARYCAIEHRFLELQAQARRDHHHAVTLDLRSLRARKRLTHTSLDVRDWVSDWTYFSGPTADPRRDCTSEQALEACERLAEELDIDRWAQGIDELVLDVENTYETVSDKLFHYRLFLWGVALEVVVVGLIIGLLFQ